MKDSKIIKILFVIIVILVVILSIVLGLKIRNEKIAEEKLQSSINVINEFYTSMESVKEEVSNCQSIEMTEVVMKSANVIEVFNAYDTSDGNEADVFIEQVRSSAVYELYCTDYITGKLTSNILTENVMFIQTYRLLFTECIESILIERPSICGK